MSLITAPGIYLDITTEQYFSDDLTPDRALSSSGVKTLITKTPAEYRYGRVTETAAMRMGDVCHQLALGKGAGIAIGEFDAWRSNEAKAFKAEAEAAGKTPIIRAKYEEAAALAETMVNDIKFALTAVGKDLGLREPAGGWQYETEAVFAWQEQTANGPIWLKGMADVWCEELLTVLDPKFTKIMHDGAVEKHAASMGWDIQSTFYRRGLEEIMPEHAGRIRFVNLLISPDAPFLSRPIAIDEAWRTSCAVEINRAIGIFSRCVKENKWPGFPDGVQIISASSWLIAQRMEAELMEEQDAS